MCTDDYYLLLCTDNYYLLRVHTTTICYVYRQLLSVMCFHSPAITTCYVYTIRQLLSAMYTHFSNYYLLRVCTLKLLLSAACTHSGNYYLAMLTQAKSHRLLVEVTDWEYNAAYSEYSSFVVSEAATDYTLSALGEYSGTAGRIATCSPLTSSLAL